MPILATSPQALITTICSVASYTNGTPNPGLIVPFNNAISAGSSLSSSLAQVGAHNTLSLQMFSAYDSAFRAYQLPLFNSRALNNADVADVIAINAQLVSILDALASTSAAHLNAVGFASYVSALQGLISTEHMGVNRKLAEISCDKQNSLNSIGSDLLSVFNELRAQPWLSSFFTIRAPWSSVPSITCPGVCITSTIPISTTGLDTNIITVSTATVEMTTTTSSISSVTGPNTEVTGSRTVSGSVQRCLVRPTSATSITTPDVVEISSV